jgi:hypothetical protein
MEDFVADQVWSEWGFAVQKGTYPLLGLTTNPAGMGSMEISAVIVPWWFFVAATSVLPAVRLRAIWRRLRRIRRGLCTDCGYDLTGNTSGTCPECGRAVLAMGAT